MDELLRIEAAYGCFASGDQAISDELVETHLECLHHVLLPSGDGIPKLSRSTFPHEVAHGVGPGQNLERRDPPTSDAGDESLVDDGFERSGELNLDLRLLFGGENVDDSIYRLGGVVRVKGGEHKVSCLGDGQCCMYRLDVTHLTDHDNIWVLSETGAECVRETGNIDAQLSLVDDSHLVFVDIFDRVLDGQDVNGSIGVDPVDHGGKGCRLSGTGRSSEEDEALMPLDHLRAICGQSEIVECGDVERYPAQRQCHRAPLHEQVPPESRGIIPTEREIDCEVGLHALHQLLREHRVGKPFYVSCLQGGPVGDRPKTPVDADERPGSHSQMQIGSLHREQLIDERLQRPRIHSLHVLMILSAPRNLAQQMRGLQTGRWLIGSSDSNLEILHADLPLGEEGCHGIST